MPQTPSDYRIPSYFQSPSTLPTTNWLPDQPDYQSPGFNVCINAYPKSETSYGPLASLSTVGYPALPSQPVGLYSFLDQSGAVHVFAGTATKLYRIHTGDTAFVDVSQALHTYAATIDNAWFMTAYANSVIATDGADAPQVFTIGNTTFLDLGGSPPIARYVATVRDFVVFANTSEGGNPFPQRVHWSAIGNSASYPTLGTTAAASVQSDAQDLRADLGWIRGIASGLQSADAAVFMDQGVYTMNYVGSPAVFSFQIAQGTDGCLLPNTIVSHRGYAYYLSPRGFVAFDGVQPRPIGSQKIDDFFFNDPDHQVNRGMMNKIVGGASTTGRFIYWLYPSLQSTGNPNRLLIYNYLLDKWGLAKVDAVWIGRALSLGFSLDQLDVFGTLDTLGFSLDSIVWEGGTPFTVFFDTNFVMSGLGGPNMAATFETSEVEPSPNRRSRVTMTRPLVDGNAGCTMAVGYRQRLGDPVTYTNPVTENWFGECPQLVDARYVRCQVNIPAGAQWTHMQGAVLDYGASTRR